jgi:hypothetical protein
MKSALNPDEIYYVVNAKGRRTHILLPIKEYERLVKNQYDSEIAESRSNEKSIPLEEVVARIESQRSTSGSSGFTSART